MREWVALPFHRLETLQGASVVMTFPAIAQPSRKGIAMPTPLVRLASSRLITRNDPTFRVWQVFEPEPITLIMCV